ALSRRFGGGRRRDRVRQPGGSRHPGGGRRRPPGDSAATAVKLGGDPVNNSPVIIYVPAGAGIYVPPTGGVQIIGSGRAAPGDEPLLTARLILDPEDDA